MKTSAAAALAALGVTFLAGTAVIGDATIASVTVSPVLIAAVGGVGLLRSWLGWRPTRPVSTPINLALCFGVAIALIATRATVNAGDPPGGLHAMAEVLALVLALRTFALIDAARIRSALLLSLGSLIGGAAVNDVGAVLPWLLIWLVAAVVCLIAIAELSSSQLPSLTGSDRPTRPRWDRRAREAAVVVALILLAGCVVVIVDPDPGRALPRVGGRPGARQVAPYVGHEQSLDTSRRGELSDDVVMKVRSAAPDFWRGESFDEWDGREWHRSAVTDAEFRVAPEGFVPAGIGDQPGGGQTLVQRVHVEAPYMQAIFGAYRIDEIDTAIDGMTVLGDGSIDLRRPIGPGTEYTVISLREDVTPALLRANDPGPASDLPPRIAELYLQLPTVPARVTALAHQLADRQPTAYDKVLAIEAWLGANTRYTLAIPPLPDGADAVDQHLFVDRAGFCEQIATSTAVLLRSVGVPARVATGFVPGEESLLGGEFTVRAKDAHAWVEVWFPGVGWQAFDPTADVPLAGASSRGPAQRAVDLLQRIAPVLAIVAGLLLLGVLAWVAARRLAARRAAVRSPWATRYLARLEAAGASRGRPRAPPETPAEYAAALAATVLPDVRLVSAAAVLTQAAYGRSEPAAAARTEADAVLAEVAAAHPARSRRGRRPRPTRSRRNGRA